MEYYSEVYKVLLIASTCMILKKIMLTEEVLHRIYSLILLIWPRIGKTNLWIQEKIRTHSNGKGRVRIGNDCKGAHRDFLGWWEWSTVFYWDIVDI